MGAGPMDNESTNGESPRHRVTVSSFGIGRYEVTRQQYEAFLTATGYVIESGCAVLRDYTDEDGYRNLMEAVDTHASWHNPGFGQTDDHPAVCIAWRDAEAYVQWLTEETGKVYRLPSEGRVGVRCPRRHLHHALLG